MKVILNGNDLADAVSKVIKAVATKTSNSVMEGIKLKAERGSLILTATDLELTIQKSIPAEVKIEGQTVVPGKYFDSFVKKLTKEQIELILDEHNRLKIKYGGSEGSLQCFNTVDFPKLPEATDGDYFIADAASIKELVSKTAFSVCQDDARPVLKGVLLEIDAATITAVALDGYRLAKCVRPLKKASADIKVIVPVRCLNEISRLIEDVLDPIAITVQRNFLHISLGHTLVISRLLEGEFINYRQIMPTEFFSVVTLPTSQLAEALDRAILFGTEKNNLVRFDIRGETMQISSDSSVGSVQEKLPVKLSGNELTIAFNARYFIELLRCIDSENVTVKFESATRPCIAEPSKGGEELNYLVLPVRLN